MIETGDLKLPLADTLSSDHFIVIASHTHQVHTVGQSTDIVMFILLDILEGFEFAAYQVENSDRLDVVVFVYTDIIGSRIWKNGNTWWFAEVGSQWLGVEVESSIAIWIDMRKRKQCEKGK